jgi:hypothetical protein
MEIFLVKVFTEGKKVVGKAFLSKKRFLISYQFLIRMLIYILMPFISFPSSNTLPVFPGHALMPQSYFKPKFNLY